jgi:hypothetical protein
MAVMNEARHRQRALRRREEGRHPTQHRCRAQLYKRSIIAQIAIERDNLRFHAK